MSYSIKARNSFISKGIYVLLFHDFKWMSSLVKEINKLISKGMYVLLFNVFNGCLV